MGPFYFGRFTRFQAIISDWPRTVQASGNFASKIDPPNLTGTREAEEKTACACARARSPPKRSLAGTQRSEPWGGKPAAPREPQIFRQTAQIVQAAQSRKPSLVQGAQARVGAL